MTFAGRQTAPGIRRLRVSAETLIHAGTVVAAMLAISVNPGLFSDGDTYWHLKAGEWIVAHVRIPHQDVFSYTHLGRPWIPQEWLSEVLMSVAFRAGGWAGLLVLFGTAMALTAWIMAAQLRRSLTGVSLLLCLVLAYGCSRVGLLARPHLLALPVMALWVSELVTARAEQRGPRWWLVPLMAIWANLHGTFLFGFIPFAAMTAEIALERGPRLVQRLRPWVVVGALAALASLATPVSYHAYLNAFETLAIGNLGVIDEWNSFNFVNAIPVEVAILWTIFVCIHRGVRVPVIRLTLLLFVLHLTLEHQRHVLLLAVIGPMILAGPIGEALEHQPRPRGCGFLLATGVVSALAAISVATLAIGRVRTDDPVSPATAVSRVPAEVAARPVFNSYNFGGYLIFRGLRPYIDGRADLYGAKHVHTYVAAQSDPTALREILARQGVQWTVLRPSDPATATMDTMPGWHRLYQDPYAVVHLRNTEVPQGTKAPARP